MTIIFGPNRRQKGPGERRTPITQYTRRNGYQRELKNVKSTAYPSVLHNTPFEYTIQSSPQCIKLWIPSDYLVSLVGGCSNSFLTTHLYGFDTFFGGLHTNVRVVNKKFGTFTYRTSKALNIFS